MCCWHGCTCHDNEYDSSTEPTGMLGVNTHSVKLYEKVMAMLGCTQCSSWKTRCEVFDGSIWCLVFDVSIRRCAGRKGNQCSFSSCISQVSCSLRTTPFMSFNHKKAQGLGASISCTDDRLSGLPLVFKMPRLLRLLAHRKYWKSSQWHNWLLHFSPLCYLEYFHSHTIVAGWNSHAWCISFLQTVCLLIFWSQHRSTFFFISEWIRGTLWERESHFETHSFLHIADCVREWDLLRNFSAYPYQNMDDHLVWLVSITRHTEQKIHFFANA